ncbi:hypothetical protein OHA10_13300 [Kribbella sp. NBC_00662]|uniref:hypothetical protein n=1 Tax=Kribbella sp. NBC_00662 TaxID=2975969 RepID=UPI00324B226A
MGQFKQYVESYDPTPLRRAIQIVVSLILIVRAVVDHNLENIVWAVWFATLMLPSGIAPDATRRRLDTWERTHPVLSESVMFVLMTGGAFVLLRYFFNRPHSILLAVALTAILSIIGAAVRRRRTSGVSG